MVNESNIQQPKRTGKESKSNETKSGKQNNWIKCFGVAGFMFFMIKGLLWLVVPGVLIWLGYSR